MSDSQSRWMNQVTWTLRQDKMTKPNLKTMTFLQNNFTFARISNRECGIKRLQNIKWCPEHNWAAVIDYTESYGHVTTIQRKIDRAARGWDFSPERTQKIVCRGCKNMKWNRLILHFTSVMTSLHFWPWLYTFHQGAGLCIVVRLFEVKRVKTIKFYISDGFSNRQGFFLLR